MVTGSGDGHQTTSKLTSNTFRTPASSRARDDTNFSHSISRSRTPLGSMTFTHHVRTFAHHVRTKCNSKPQSYLVDWREGLPELPAILPTSSGGADPGAPAPIVGTITKRANEIYKLDRHAASLKGSWDKFGNVFEFHPNLFTIHNAKVFKLPYTSVMEIQQSISEAILSYSIMSEAEQLDLDSEDQY